MRQQPPTPKMETLRNAAEVSIINAVRSSWTLSNNKNNELCNHVFGTKADQLSDAMRRRYYSNNDDALQAFLTRKSNGLGLSDRVWQYTNSFKTEIELGLDMGIRSGLDAASMARDLKQYLKYPDKLFCRVRDERGQLHLSKAAAEFHPGRGVYRSSYKNARRLAVTETNMAYHTADYLRWQQMDFVVGIEVRLSSNHTLLGGDGTPHEFADICDELQGRYPKDFKFTGWHPHCRCFAVSILKTEEEMEQDTQRILNGEEPTPSEDSENAVSDLPDKFKTYIQERSETISNLDEAHIPYYIRDNRAQINPILGITPPAAAAEESSPLAPELKQDKKAVSSQKRESEPAQRNNGLSYLISDYYSTQGNKAKVDILKQITQDKSFKALRYHSTKDNTIFGVNMGAFDKELQQKELPKNLALAKKLVANKMDVYLLPNSSTGKSADFVVSRNGKLYYLEGKTLNGDNSLNHLLGKGATQSERICVDIIGNNNTKYVAENVEKAFRENPMLREIILLKGSRLVTITRQQAKYRDFRKMFKTIWQQNK